MKKIIFILSLFSISYSFGHAKNKVIELQNQSVIVSGKTDDLKAFKNLNWMNDSYLFGGYYIYTLN